MSIFKNKNNGGLMDVIRCDEPSYLIWKWHPAGAQVGQSKKENSIRWGSAIRVKDGEVAVFVYSHNNGIDQDFIEGPYDDILTTKNLPVLTKIIGLAYNGDSPFQAEVYFINMSGIIQQKFAVTYFDIFDTEYPDYPIPVAVRGTFTYRIADYRAFIKLHRLIDFDLSVFQDQTKDAVNKYIKGVVGSAPRELNIPAIQIENYILPINGQVDNYVIPRLENEFGVIVSSIDISAIEIDKTSEGYQQLKEITRDIRSQTTKATADATIKNIYAAQEISAEHIRDTLRMQREEEQYAKHMSTETANIGAHTVDKQADVGKAGAEALGQMGAKGATNIQGNSGLNAAGLMTGIMLGGTIGSNLSGMMGDVLGGLGEKWVTPPPVPEAKYFVAVDGKATGPFDLATIKNKISNLDITGDTLLWEEGLDNWKRADEVDELTGLFKKSTPPPVPPNT